MAENENFILNMSVLYRNVMKYFDRVLGKFDIGSGQIIFLTYINENEGCTMNDVTKVCEVDKGTTTKSINRLIEQGYVQSMSDEHDKRSKRLYTTQKATEVMNAIYKYRNECRNVLAKGVDFDVFNDTLNTITDNSRGKLEPGVDLSGLKIGGLIKTTLLDYPEKIACTVFASGCSFKCPYCHNRDLVYIPENYEFLEPEEVLAFLEKRKNILEGVCISGGEPLLQEKLIDFLRAVKEMGYSIKLDVTGNFLDRLKNIIAEGLVDYIAMDIKNTKEKYGETVGNENGEFDCSYIDESIDYIKRCGIPYEFRTTVVKEFHTKEDLLEIAKWIGECDHWYLQQFVNSENCISNRLHAYSDGELIEIFHEVKQINPCVKLRGVKG